MNARKVWLTFDDGPRTGSTDIVLDTLARFNVQATFFVVGNRVAANSTRIKRILAEGHRIGNHTYDHLRLVGQSKETIIEQIEQTEKVLTDFQPRDPIIRPPYGAHDAFVDKVIAETGYRQVLWNVDTLDWRPDYKPDGWVQHGIDQIKAKKNAIVLMHDIHLTTAENLNLLIQKINALGDTQFQPPSTLALPPSNQENIYIVVKGDTLSKIAREFYNDASKWQLIFDANRSIIDHPDKIYPGLALIIPAIES